MVNNDWRPGFIILVVSSFPVFLNYRFVYLYSVWIDKHNNVFLLLKQTVVFCIDLLLMFKMQVTEKNIYTEQLIKDALFK